MIFDQLQGLNPQWAAAVQVIANPAAIRRYLDTRAVLQDQLYLQRLLPPVRSTQAQIVNGNVRVIAAPAHATALDSPYHPVGAMKATFNRNTTFKLTGTTLLNEQEQDAMHAAAQNVIVAAQMRGQLGDATDTYRRYLAMVVEAGAMALDLGEEKFRALTLALGKLDVMDGNGERAVHVKADFGIDFSAKSKQYLKRGAGAGRWLGGDSKFWDDVDAARQWLRGEPTMITDPVTFGAIAANPANRIVVKGRVDLTPTTQLLTLARAAVLSGTEVSDAFTDIDVRRNVQVIVYGLKDEVTGEYFWPANRVSFFTRTAQRTTLIDGVIVEGGLGVTHQGPTTEIGNVPGRYMNAYVPQGRPYQFVVEEAEDILTEITSARNLFLVDLNAE